MRVIIGRRKTFAGFAIALRKIVTDGFGIDGAKQCFDARQGEAIIVSRSIPGFWVRRSWLNPEGAACPAQRGQCLGAGLWPDPEALRDQGSGSG
jgi:hypothetical protein